jgi:hypothetical protein
LIAARRHRSRMGHAVSLALFCLFPCLAAGAQSQAVSPPDLHQLQQQVATLTARIDATSLLVTALLLLPIAVACLVLWWNARRFRAFGSVGMYLLMVSALFYADYLRSGVWDAVFSSLASLFIVEMAADALHVPKHRWIAAVRLVCLAGVAVCWVHRLQWFVLVPIDLSSLAVFVLLIIRLVRPIRQARLILPAIAIIFLFRLPLDPTIHSFVPLPFSFTIAGLRWYFGPCAMVLFGAAAITIFVLELIEDQRERNRLSAELDAGRAMQQVLLGAELPDIPGLHIESVYRPASEVGGDFFQVLPAPDGGGLIVIGDVSGKGLRAAMTVSTILGALRALPVASPAELLRMLNLALAGRLERGLVTCCIANVSPRGILTTANAGHLAPYRNGEEVPLESGLPLGVTADAIYAESTLTLTLGDSLTFLSDGVVEAQSPSGELFGFDRTREISGHSAEEIARAAQAFGQQDDITVLTLQFAPAEVTHA